MLCSVWACLFSHTHFCPPRRRAHLWGDNALIPRDWRFRQLTPTRLLYAWPIPWLLCLAMVHETGPCGAGAETVGMQHLHYPPPTAVAGAQKLPQRRRDTRGHAGLPASSLTHHTPAPPSCIVLQPRACCTARHPLLQPSLFALHRAMGWYVINALQGLGTLGLRAAADWRSRFCRASGVHHACFAGPRHSYHAIFAPLPGERRRHYPSSSCLSATRATLKTILTFSRVSLLPTTRGAVWAYLSVTERTCWAGAAFCADSFCRSILASHTWLSGRMTRTNGH